MINTTELKRYLKISQSDTTNDTFLQSCIDSAIAEVEKYCNRSMASGSFTEYLDGNNSFSLYLRHYPVHDITSLEYLEFDDYEELILSPDTIQDSVEIIPRHNMIRLKKGYIFPKGELNIKTVYTAGFNTSGNSPCPDDLKKALLELASEHYYNSKIGESRLGVTGSNLNTGVSDGKTYEKIDVTGILKKYRIMNI